MNIINKGKKYLILLILIMITITASACAPATSKEDSKMNTEQFKAKFNQAGKDSGLSIQQIEVIEGKEQNVLKYVFTDNLRIIGGVDKGNGRITFIMMMGALTDSPVEMQRLVSCMTTLVMVFNPELTSEQQKQLCMELIKKRSGDNEAVRGNIKYSCSVEDKTVHPILLFHISGVDDRKNMGEATNTTSIQPNKIVSSESKTNSTSESKVERSQLKPGTILITYFDGNEVEFMVGEDGRAKGFDKIRDKKFIGKEFMHPHTGQTVKLEADGSFSAVKENNK